jgi:large repetitive protein
MARAQFDRGAVPPDLPMGRMQLVLTRSPEQQTALDAMLVAQQDNSSASFHKWLTPEQFGQQFGAADPDVQVISSWLQSHGFQVNHVARGRNVIEFSGTAELVRNAFHTEIHKYVVNGEEHWANASDPQIPEALAPVVAGVAALHNFRAKPLYRLSDKWPKVPTKGGRQRPAYNGQDGSELAPGDFATIYNINPLYQAGINGSGVTIGIVGEGPILIQDIVDFRKAFGLPKNPPQVVVNGTSPDYFQTYNDVFGPDVEGTLDVSWSGAIAPNATVKFLVASDTDTTDSVTLSEEYAVDNNDVDILSESFYTCESDAGAALVQMVNGLREQAAAQGITWVASSGDAGPYTCFDNVISPPGPLTVNLLAASPYVVAVGGTEFTSASLLSSTYWSIKNNSETLASAVSHPPEDVWNDSCSAAKCGTGNVVAAASGGGASQVFGKPSWQSGVEGIPSDGARDIPDLSFTASADNAPYLICLDGSCEGTITPSSFTPIGGTSAPTPSFAGIMALVNQKMQSRQGQVNDLLYHLAASQQYSKCNGSSTTAPASTCIFNDVTSGDSSVPGEPNYGKPTAKFPAFAGYDLATGLGSVNVANLVNNWGSVSSHATSTALTINPGTLAHGTQVNVDASVTPQSGSGIPTGSVAIEAASRASYGSFPLANGSVASTLASLPGGTYTVHAHYAGDSSFAPSDSAAVPVTVTPEASRIAAGALYAFDIPYALYTSGPYGNVSLALSARVAGLSGQGVATGKVTFTDNGQAINGGTGLLNTEAQALSFNTNIVFPVGKHSIVASYAGDPSFEPGISPPLNITITPAQTTTTVQTSVGEAESGKQVTLTAIVEAGNSQFGNPETGTVTFFLNGKSLGTRFLSPNLDFSTGLSNAIALLHTATLPTGTNTITATYTGDSNYAGSSSQPATVMIKSQAPACLVTNFTADPNPITLYDPPNTTMIFVTAKCQFDVRTGSPGGALLGSGKDEFFQTAQISKPTTFYLQQSGNTTSQGTLQELAVGVQSGSPPCTVLTFGATPDPIISSTLTGSTTITAVAVTAISPIVFEPCNFDVRQGAPNGLLLGSTQGVLVQTTSDTVTNGTQFFLQQQGNTTPKGTLATLTVAVQAAAPANP